MEFYDPLKTPDPDEWLALDEGERALLVEEYHKEEGVDLPNSRLHAYIHAVVENQLALEEPPQILGTLERLLGDGLDRHEAIHAIGSVLSEQIFKIMKNPSKNADPAGAYNEGLKELTAEKWFASGD